MKLRILNNSIRFRLAKAEVTKFHEQGEVKAATNFGKNILVYRILKGEGETMTADFSDGQISVFIPAATIEKWATTEMVSIQVTIIVAGDQSLRILVEKDFKCLTDRPSEDESGLFENPGLAH